MLFDGRARATEIQTELIDQCKDVGQLVVVAVAPDAAGMSYMRIKQKVGEKVGVNVRIDTVSADGITAHIRELAEDDSVAGIVVQLPLPEDVDAAAVLGVIPPEKDPDALGLDPRVLSPVARGVLDILAGAEVNFKDAQIVVVGRGALVGKPVAEALFAKGAHLTIVDEHTSESDFEAALKQADVIVSGAGVPGLIQPHMLTRGVVLVDAGTSEKGGAIVGDADEACESVASLMTPVPGGVGPLAVTMLFANLCDLWKTNE